MPGVLLRLTRKRCVQAGHYLLSCVKGERDDERSESSGGGDGGGARLKGEGRACARERRESKHRVGTKSVQLSHSGSRSGGIGLFTPVP